MRKGFFSRLSDIFKREKATGEYLEAAVKNNGTLLFLISIFAALIELFNIFRVFFLTKGVGISTRNNFIYFMFYLTLLIFCVLYIGLYKWTALPAGKRYGLYLAGGTVFLLWQTLFNIYDVMRTNSEGNFTLSVVFMAFAAIFMMKPVYFAANLGGMYLLFMLTAGRTVSFGTQFNFSIMTLMCCVVYYQRYRHEEAELAWKREIDMAHRAYQEECERFRLTHEQYEIVCRTSRLITFEWDIKKGSVHFSEQWGAALGQPLYVPDLERFVNDSKRLPQEDKKRIRACIENVKNKVPYQKTEVRVPGNDGRTHWYELRLTTQENSEGEPVFGIGILQDIMEQKRRMKKIERLARTDFTGVLNKTAIEEYGRERIGQLRPEDTLIMLILDLDDFKQINDTEGHPVGDYVLNEVAARMQEEALSGMYIGRIGGDEFMALLAGSRELNLRLVHAYAERILEQIGQIRLSENRCGIKASIGIAALKDQSPMTYEALYAEADKALYEAKRAGKGAVRWGGVPPMRALWRIMAEGLTKWASGVRMYYGVLN